MRAAGRHGIPGREWPDGRTGARIGLVLRRALIVPLVLLLTAAPVGAGTIVVKLGLTPGNLSVASAPVKAAAGSTVRVAVKVADGRGNGKGWTLRFAGATGLQVVGITATCAAHSTSTLPRLAAGPGGSRVLEAAHGTGMGVVDLVVTVRASAASRISFSVA